MFEIAVRAKVQRFQAGRGNVLEQSLSAQADGVPGQAKCAACFQLPGPNRKHFADQSGGGTVPLPANAAYVGLAAVHHTVRGVGYVLRETPP